MGRYIRKLVQSNLSEVLFFKFCSEELSIIKMLNKEHIHLWSTITPPLNIVTAVVVRINAFATDFRDIILGNKKNKT